MAFSTPVFEVQTGGDDTFGGGFDPSSAMTWPTDGAATSATGSAPVFTSASYTFVAGDVGAWVFIRSGTNWTPGWYKITSVSAGAATLDAAVGHCPMYVGSTNIDGGSASLNTVAGCATVASPSSATWGVDYSQSTSARITFTDMVIDGTTNTKFSSVGNPVGKNFIGNIINVTSGTGFTVQRVLVKSTSGTVATCDKSLGTLSSTGGNGKMGGCLATPGLASSLVVAQGGIFIKSGSYSITSASTNVAGGCLRPPEVLVSGYGTYRHDLGTAPVLTASGINTFTIADASVSNGRYENITVDGASLTSSRGFGTGPGHFYRCTAQNCTNTGFASGSGSAFIGCYATGCSTAGAGFLGAPDSFYYGCEAYNNSVVGFNFANTGFATGCLSYSNTGATTDGFLCSTGSGTYLINCSAYGNGRDGFRLTTHSCVCLNCIAESNSGWGFNITATTNGPCVIDYCSTYNNTSGAIVGGIAGTAGVRLFSGHNVTTSASAFTNPASGDLSLNNSANGGLLLRGTGYPGLFLRGTTHAYADIGAAEAPYAVAGQGGVGFFIQ